MSDGPFCLGVDMYYGHSVALHNSGVEAPEGGSAGAKLATLWGDAKKSRAA